MCGKMSVVSKIHYREIHSLDALRELFQYNVCSLDFEFKDGNVPAAYCVAAGSYVRGFRLGKYPGNERTRGLRLISDKEFAMRFQSLVKKRLFKVFIVYGAGDFYGLCKLYDKIGYKDILPSLLVCNIQPVLAKQLKENTVLTYASLVDAAYLMDISLLGYQRHNPCDDAVLLFEMAKRVIQMTDAQYHAYRDALNQLVESKNINTVKATYQARITSEAVASISMMQEQSAKLIEIKNDIQCMKKLLDEMKQTREHHAHIFLMRKKNHAQPARQQGVENIATPAIQQVDALHAERYSVRPLFVDEVLFHYPKNDPNQSPGAMTVRHNNKCRNYMLEFDKKTLKKLRKTLKLEEPALPLDALAGRYKSQTKQGITVVFIVQKAQYNRATSAHFETLLKTIIPSDNYEICEV